MVNTFGPAKYQPEYFYLSEWMHAEMEGLQYVPPMTIFAVGVHVLDLLAVPVKGIKSIIKNGKNQKAFKLLSQAVFGDEVIEVQDKLYRRAVSNLRGY
jgi:hypothetical protein